tara:strand:- start:15059 stop:16081 length:1023 start_codon:yes stop_codon:yes gene_type:complete
MKSTFNFKDKTILVTGGTGSFGQTVAGKFIDKNIKELRIFSRDEKKQDDMRKAFSSKKIKFYLGDVRIYSSINDAMRNVDLVFHAAALKQVPSCEFYPMEAVRTNVLGAENVLSAAINNNVKQLVVLSTDKAVYPINAMGISKAMMEKITLAKTRLNPDCKTKFSITRYGNVMGSRGSVIPLFIKLIKEKKPITITDPQMTRFLMSLQDSVKLVINAFTHSSQGDLFVQKAPACTIITLAEALKELFNSNVDINYIGTRHGEKIYESLLSREEMAKAQDIEEYYRVPLDNRDLNYSETIINKEYMPSSNEDYTSHNTERLNVEGVKKLLLKQDFMLKELR